MVNEVSNFISENAVWVGVAISVFSLVVSVYSILHLNRIFKVEERPVLRLCIMELWFLSGIYQRRWQIDLP